MNNILFTRDAGLELQRQLERLAPAGYFLLSDTYVRAYCLSHLGHDLVPPGRSITLSPGEKYKTLPNVGFVWERLSADGAKRNSLLVNLGGGVVTDLGGFAASCFKRGIRCINIPTTLLAQVDASVGGKTGIDFNGLKNEIGTFATPECVIIDNGFLATLPPRQLLSGFAEMIKHALLADEQHLADIMRVDLSQAASPEFLPLIQRSVAVKAAIVDADPLEQGERKALNLGHTIGHAIEGAAISKGLDLTHGEAVAYGIIAELWLSVRLLGFDRACYEAVRAFILEKYPPYSPVETPAALYEWMLHDKKNEREGVNFTLLREPGRFETDCYCDREDILQALLQIQPA